MPGILHFSDSQRVHAQKTPSAPDTNKTPNSSIMRSIKNNNTTTNMTLNASQISTPGLKTLQKTRTVNMMALSRLPVTSLSALSKSGSKMTVNLEEQKKQTRLSENVTKAAKSLSEQTLLQSIRGTRNNMLLSALNPPNSAGQILFNAHALAKLAIMNKTSNSTSNPKPSSSTAVTETNPKFSSYNAFGTTFGAQPITVTEAAANIGWSGLKIEDNVNPKYLPPDPAIAAGPNHIIEMANNVMRLWDKNGGAVTNVVHLQDFFGTGNVFQGGDFITDPKILFDASSGHWFASILDAGKITNVQNFDHSCKVKGCSVIVAVSANDNPTGQWTIYTFPSGVDLWDQPIIATSDDKLVISVNVFNDLHPDGIAQIVVSDKASMVSSGTLSYQTSGLLNNELSVHPAQPLSTTSCMYLVSVFHRGTDHLRLSSICGNPASGGATFNLNIAQIPMGTSLSPISGTQPSAVPIFTGDGRISSAVYYDGKIWDGFNDACIPKGTSSPQACIRLQEIDVNKQTMLFDNYITAPGVSTYYPILTMNSAGKMLLAFGASSSTLPPSIMIGDESFSIASLASGSTSVNDKAGLPPTPRFGDYFGTSLDPDGRSMWIGAEYGNNPTTGWSTFIGRVS